MRTTLLYSDRHWHHFISFRSDLARRAEWDCGGMVTSATATIVAATLPLSFIQRPLAHSSPGSSSMPLLICSSIRVFQSSRACVLS